MKESIFMIEPMNFADFRSGSGSIAVAESFIRNIDNLILVGVSSVNEKWGNLKLININNKEIPFIPILKQNILDRVPTKNFIFSLFLKKYISDIVEKYGMKYIFTQCYSVLWLLANSKYNFKICYYYPGMEPPFLAGRYKNLGRILLPFYYYMQSMSINKAQIVLSAASDKFIEYHRNILLKYGLKKNIEFYKFPPPVNQYIFKIKDKKEARIKLNLNQSDIIFIFVGRIERVKGLDLIMNSFKLYINKYDDKAKLLIIGDGSLRNKLESVVNNEKINDKILFLGRKDPADVSEYISASDVCLFASYAEGFSVSMIECVLSGRPCVTTYVSGVDDLIEVGKNGFIVNTRNIEEYAKYMYLASNLKEEDILEISKKKCILFDEKVLWKNVIRGFR